MSNLQVFSFESQEVRTVIIHDEPWFVAMDVCQHLTIGNVSDAVGVLGEDEKGIATIEIINTGSGKGLRAATNRTKKQDVLVVNESGLYSLIFQSRKDAARKFQKWVTSEVLPSIRKHGAYIAPTATVEGISNAMSPEQRLAMLSNTADFLTRIGSLTDWTKAKLADEAINNISTSNTVNASTETMIHLGQRVLDRGLTLNHGQSIRAGRIASAMHQERHGKRPSKTKMVCNGSYREVSVYHEPDWDILDAAITEVTQSVEPYQM